MAVITEKPVVAEQENDEGDSSDIAESTEVSEEDSSGDESGSDEEDDEDDDGASEQLSSGSSEDTEYDSDNVWTEDENELEVETKEATEAAIMSDFQGALDLILNGNKEKAKRKFQKILKQPSVSKYKTTEFLWDNDVIDNSHLNKMGRVFVGTHKNLAAIDEENAIDHYLQVVGIAPRNDEVWFDLGQKLVQKGDLDMAIYAFQQTEDWRAEEALMSTHFLKKNYKTSLKFVAAREERLGPFCKGNFLKNRIACISEDLREYTRRLFGKDSFEVEESYEREASFRLSALQSKLMERIEESSSMEETKEERMEPIYINLSSKQTAWDIITVFCDLFDRIQAYSEIFSQRIFIEEWECREDELIVEDTVERIVNDVVSVDSVVNKIVNGVVAAERVEEKSAAPAAAATTTAAPVRRPRKRGQKEEGKETFKGDESSCDEDERPDSVDSVALREPYVLEDVNTYYLDARPVRPLREGSSQAPSRMTATPGHIGCDQELLTLIRETIYEERYLTIVKALEICLYSIVTIDLIPSRSSSHSEILIQCYRRWIQSSNQLLLPHQLSIHALLVMYNESMAMDYCMRVLHGRMDGTEESRQIKFAEKRDLIRFIHMRVERINGEDGMKWLKILKETIREDDVFYIPGGVISHESISDILEKKEKARRIHSLKHLSHKKKWNEIVSIVESDTHWNEVDDDDELSVRTKVYTKALSNVGKEEKAIEIINRMLSFLLSLPSLPSSTITSWIKLLRSINLINIPSNSKMLPSLGYSLLRLTEHTHLSKDWKLWKILHQVIKRIEESKPSLLMELFNESIEKDDYDRADDYDELPCRSLRFLVHAHDKMTMNGGVCGQKNGAFLSYCLSEFREVMEREDVRETLTWKKLKWLVNNVQAELYQLMHCSFGRYSKKKRSAEDHETGLEIGEGKKSKKMMESAIALCIPNPIPEYDDKGTGGMDLIDLINNRFPSFLQMDERRRRRVEELKRWIERGPVWKGEMDDGENREDKMRSLLQSWPHDGIDSKLESVVHYLFSIHYHRQSKNDEAAQYASFFLSSQHCRSFGDEVTKGAWIILAYASIERLFKLYDDDLLLELNRHIRPMRVAKEIAKKSDATVCFLMAQSLYQAASRITRFFRKLPEDDTRLVMHGSIIDDLREETAQLFERVLEVAPSMQEAHQSAWDFQWMSYFYLAKLHMKGEKPDVVKAVDGLFEAACALQMGGTSYLQKISVKNQKNLEPVEVHYQAYSAIWKYITRIENPSFEVLIRLKSYTDSFSRHGVVKPSAAMDLYEIEPVISETVTSMSYLCARKEDGDDAEFVLNTTMDKMELIEELKTACKDAFKIVVERFPHRKAYYRLAEIALRDGDFTAAHTFIFKKIFPRKKKEEDLFEGVIEFSSTDIERSDSLSFHTTRSLRLGLAVAVRVGEAASAMAVCTVLAKVITDHDESYVLKCSYLSMVRLATRSLSLILSSHPSQWTRNVKIEMLALHKSLIEAKENLPLIYMRSEVKKVIDGHGGVARLEIEAAMAERRPNQQRKRKGDDPTATQSIMERLGLSGRPPPPPKIRPPSILPRSNQTTPPSSKQYQSVANMIRAVRPPSSSPSRPNSSLPSTSSPSHSSLITNPNQYIMQLLQQAQQQTNAAAAASLFSQYLNKPK